MATLKVPAQVPSPEEDAAQLRKAFQGWGTDELKIVSILGHRNAAQRKLIRTTYSSTYGKDLFKQFGEELSGDFRRAVISWAMIPCDRDCILANEAIELWSSDSLWIIVEIACTRSALGLFAAKQVYQNINHRSLEEDVAVRTSGDIRKFLVPLVSTFRYDGNEVNTSLAMSEAELLREKIERQAYNDVELIRILTTRSKAQLNATLNHYKNEFGHAINKDLKSVPKDEYMKLLRCTIKCLTYPEKHFEKVLRISMKGWGTDEKALTRVVVTRAEFDLQRIAEEYQRRNGVPLHKAIADDTSGDYKAMLFALLGR